MPQPKKGYALGSDPSHQNLMLRNLARSLFEHERLKTTESKAKLLRPFAEKLITKAKHGTVHHRRQVLSEIADRAVVHKLFDDIGPRFSDRPGGYTRILKLGTRSGDGAPMALIELVDEGAAPRTVVTDESAAGGRRRLRRPGRRKSTGGEDLPQDKPAVSKAAAAGAAGREKLDRKDVPSDEEAPEAEAGAELGVSDEAETDPDAGKRAGETDGTDAAPQGN